ncbi:dolichyl pyrophosphate man9glcnac2 alpha-13-glucosyltransferase [Anaeramoeba ignava]|uniref:Alpha-1,3-glucosyltransferase n=1 Tax=Anaeramoeba ignava TaxID=1746090 RepID=A0A9Q0RDA9_ANAIG|nr:dolichyl pyrophosphate man9glcnac2 alpha-13-glucosyltransferase [Anaeramoeba ignava]
MIFQFFLSITIAILIRVFIALHSPKISEMNFEKQQQIMEFTTKNSIKNWFENQKTSNKQRIDFSPLSGYHSWLNGQIARMIDPQIVSRTHSKKDEGINQIFMRWTVIIADLVLYFPALALMVEDSSSNTNQAVQWLAMALQPALLLIDHAYFQYNSISIAFCLIAIYFIKLNKKILAFFFYSLAFFYNSNTLVFALPFVLYSLGLWISDSFDEEIDQNPKNKKIHPFMSNLFFLSILIAFIFLSFWFPFNNPKKIILENFQKIFYPFETQTNSEKDIANIWSVMSKIIPFQKRFSVLKLKIGSSILTSIFSMIINTHLFFKPTTRNLNLALFNTSLAFFLFGFQFNEEFILFPLIIATFMLQDAKIGLYMLWFILIGTFSLFPFMLTEKIFTPCILLPVLFILISWKIVSFLGHFKKLKISLFISVLICLFSLIPFFFQSSTKFTFTFTFTFTFIFIFLSWIFFLYHQFFPFNLWFLFQKKNLKTKKNQ